MLYRQLCICDDEPVYLDRLAAYLGKCAGFMWKIRTCTQINACLRESAEALLISGSVYAASTTEMQKGLRAGFGARMILLDDETEFEGKNELVSIPKYDSALVLKERLDELLGNRSRRQTLLACMYVPGNGPAAEKNGIAYLQKTSQTEKKLLISMTEYTLFDHTSEAAPGLREWFFAKETGCNDDVDLEAYAKNENGCDVIRGFRSYYDMMEISLAQWQRFFYETLRKNRYRQICLALDRLPPYPELFGWFDRVFVTWLDDGLKELKWKQFVQQMNYLDMPQISDRMEEWEMIDENNQMSGAEMP